MKYRYGSYWEWKYNRDYIIFRVTSFNPNRPSPIKGVAIYDNRGYTTPHIVNLSESDCIFKIKNREEAKDKIMVASI